MYHESSSAAGVTPIIFRPSRTRVSFSWMKLEIARYLRQPNETAAGWRVAEETGWAADGEMGVRGRGWIGNKVG